MKHVDYNQVAAVYDDRYRTGSPLGVAEMLQKLGRQVNALCVLEVGCGTGHWLTSMQDCGIRCGLDYSAGMLNKAKERDDTLSLTRGTAWHLPFQKQTFDFVFCIHAIHHFDNPQAFISEARRILRPGGALAIVGIDPHTEQDRWYVYDYFPGTYDTDLARYPSGQMMRSWMVEAGFVKCERLLAASIDHDFIGREVLTDPILQKNGTSQLSLLTDDEFSEGMVRIQISLELAEKHGEEIVFVTRIALPAVVGFVPDASGEPGRRTKG